MVKTNKLLLYLYGENARASQPSIAKRLRKSPQLMHYKIRRLEETGVIPFYHTIFDYSYAGLLLFKVYFRGGYTKRSELKKLITILRNDDLVVSIYEVGAEYDLIVEFLAHNPSEFNKVFKGLISKNPGLKNYDVIFNIVTYLFPRNYLLPKNRRTEKNLAWDEIVVGGDRERISFSDNERSILNAILVSPKMSYAELAVSLKLNIKTVIATVKSLISRKVIRGFRASLDVEQIGLLRKRVVLKLHNLDIDRERKLAEFCKVVPEIVTFSKILGRWDVEMDIEAVDNAHFRRIYLNIRDEFQDIIQSFNSYDIYKEHMRQYLIKL